MSDPTPSLEHAQTSLREAGYNASIVGGLLIIRDVPYVSPTLAVEVGVFAFAIELSNDLLIAGGDHTLYFFGEHPCDQFGSPLDLVAGANESFDIPGVGVAKFRFSRKRLDASGTPVSYASAREKLEVYIDAITTSATRLDPGATAKTGRVPVDVPLDSPFVYPDSASVRVGVGHLNRAFEGQNVGIVGLGGTGAYVLDLVAKTPVPSIHLFDGGRFRSHSAFRAPGAAAESEVGGQEFKVDYFKRKYEVQRRGIEAHPCHVTSEQVELIRGLSFVFLAVDTVPARLQLITMLRSLRIPYIDVGMGAEVVEKPSLSLVASVRTTFWSPGTEPEPHQPAGGAVEDDYSSNIQIAELNALNATFAVIRWKKHLGYLQDWVAERESLYNTNNHSLVNP